MIVDRIFTPGLAEVSYLVADESALAVAVIDPRRDIDVYLAWAAAREMSISAILETHVHADFVSGAWELHTATGAPIYASHLGNQEFEHVALENGDQVPVGSLILEALWTPGHTPEHLAYQLIDPEVRPDPIAIFTGDLLFVGEVGRPDLLGSAHTDDLATMLFETIQTRLDHLADDVIVYPGHTAGSSCGRKLGEAPHSTMGAERAANYALQFGERDAFVAAVMDRMPTPPAYYPTMKTLNRVGPAPLTALDSGRSLSAEEVASLREEHAAIVDARDAYAFDQAHIPGSYYAGNSADFINWVGWLAPYDRPIVLVLDDDNQYPAFLTELRRIGLDNVAGYLQGGMPAWQSSGREVASLRRISPDGLKASIDAGEALAIVDVRTEVEWIDEHIPGSRNTFAGDIVIGAQAPDSSGSVIALTCASGYRSRVAASLLQARGIENIVQLEGGVDAWRNQGLPLEAA